MKKLNGFTLMELMTALAIAAILATIAVPSFQTLLQNSKQTSQLNTLTSSLVFARSEASKRSTTVSLCSSADGANCASSADWEQGWIIFVDSTNGDGDIDAGEALLNVIDAFPGTNTLTSNTFASTQFLSFNPNGTSSSAGEFLHCDKRGDIHAREITVSVTGRTKSISTNLTNTCP